MNEPIETFQERNVQFVVDLLQTAICQNQFVFFLHFNCARIRCSNRKQIVRGKLSHSTGVRIKLFKLGYC